MKNLNSSFSSIGAMYGFCSERKYSAPYLPIAKFVVRSSSNIFSAASIYASRISAQAAIWSAVGESRQAFWDMFLRSLMAFERSTAVGLLPMR